MPPRLRKLIALAVLAPGLLAWCLGAIVLADRVPDVWYAKLVYFIVAGIGWAFPARVLIRWAEQEHRPRGRAGN